MKWIRDPVREATYRTGQCSVRDLRSGAGHVASAGSAISDGFGTLIRQEFRADTRSGVEREGRISRWINGHGMITCGPGVRGWVGNYRCIVVRGVPGPQCDNQCRASRK